MRLFGILCIAFILILIAIPGIGKSSITINWAKTIRQPSSSMESPSDLLVDNFGNRFLSSNSSFGTTQTAYLSKSMGLGWTDWQVPIGTSVADIETTGTSIGCTGATIGGTSETFFKVFAADGSQVASHVFQPGGATYSAGTLLRVAADGGTFVGSIGRIPTSSRDRALLSKFSAAHSLLWSIPIPESASDDAVLSDVFPLSGGGCVAVVVYARVAKVYRFNSEGGLQWVYATPTVVNLSCNSSTSAIDASENVYLAYADYNNGSGTRVLKVFRVDSSGALAGEQQFSSFSVESHIDSHITAQGVWRILYKDGEQSQGLRVAQVQSSLIADWNVVVPNAGSSNGSRFETIASGELIVLADEAIATTLHKFSPLGAHVASTSTPSTNTGDVLYLRQDDAIFHTITTYQGSLTENDVTVHQVDASLMSIDADIFPGQYRSLTSDCRPYILPDGRILVAAWNDTPFPARRLIIYLVDNDGEVVWARLVTQLGNQVAAKLAIVPLNDGTFALVTTGYWSGPETVQWVAFALDGTVAAPTVPTDFLNRNTKILGVVAGLGATYLHGWTTVSGQVYGYVVSISAAGSFSARQLFRLPTSGSYSISNLALNEGGVIWALLENSSAGIYTIIKASRRGVWDTIPLPGSSRSFRPGSLAALSNNRFAVSFSNSATSQVSAAVYDSFGQCRALNNLGSGSFASVSGFGDQFLAFTFDQSSFRSATSGALVWVTTSATGHVRRLDGNYVRQRYVNAGGNRWLTVEKVSASGQLGESASSIEPASATVTQIVLKGNLIAGRGVETIQEGPGGNSFQGMRLTSVSLN